MKTTVHKQVLSQDEVQTLKNHFLALPAVEDVVGNGNGNINKNLDYHLANSVCSRVVKPVIDRIIGPDHQIEAGAYKECITPYTTHFDNKEYNKEITVSRADRGPHYNVAVLIPLVEGPEFNTVLFDVFSDKDFGMGQILPKEFLSDVSNDLDITGFTHAAPKVQEQIKLLPVDTFYNWKLGDILVWDRLQLHSSTDFAKSGLVKKFIIIFIA